MKVLSAIGASVKSLTAEIKSLPFSSYGGYGYGGNLPHLPNISLTNDLRGGLLPGTKYDYETAAGVLWQNPSAAACFVALTKAFAQARPFLERRKTKNGNDWERVDHEITALIERPNNFYSGEKLFGVTLICAMSQGSAFWRFEYDRRGVPAEIWYEPPVGMGVSGLAPNWDSQNFIKNYYYFVDGQRTQEPLETKDVVYFRHGLNVANPRMPWSPLGLAAREVATLNGASTYTGALMKNSAVPSGMVTLEGSGLASGTPPTPEQAEEMKRRIKSGFTGDKVGEPFVSSLPWKWQAFNWSPADLAIDQIRQWPQETVCALLGTPVIVALLPTGTQPTYENLDASMRWWWDNTIIPLEDSFADEIETQMFPAFGLDAQEYRISWDRSKVPALQEDLVEKYGMIDKSYTSGTIDLYTAQVERGIVDVPEEYKGVFHPSATAGNPQAEPVTPEEMANQERLNRAVKSTFIKVVDGNETKFSESDWERDGGKFQRYVGEKGKFWGGDSRDETSQKYFNGDFKVTVNSGVGQESKKLFGRELAAKEYGELIGAPDGEKIEVHRVAGGIHISAGDQGNFDLLMRKVGNRGNEVVMENGAFFKKSDAPKQLAPRMLAYQFKKAQELGIHRVVADAAGNAKSRQTGYSRWPQLGFNGVIKNSVKSKLPSKYRSAKDLNTLMQMEGGFEAWKKFGGRTNVSFDLSKGSTSWKIFESYLDSKGIITE